MCSLIFWAYTSTPRKLTAGCKWWRSISALSRGLDAARMWLEWWLDGGTVAGLSSDLEDMAYQAVWVVRQVPWTLVKSLLGHPEECWGWSFCGCIIALLLRGSTSYYSAFRSLGLLSVLILYSLGYSVPNDYALLFVILLIFLYSFSELTLFKREDFFNSLKTKKIPSVKSVVDNSYASCWFSLIYLHSLFSKISCKL